MAVVLINPFVVPAEKEAEFLRAWNETTRVFSEAPGYLETHLTKNMGVGDSAFQYINICLWENAESWNATHGSYKPGEESIEGVQHHPAIFQEVISAKSVREADWRLHL